MLYIYYIICWVIKLENKAQAEIRTFIFGTASTLLRIGSCVAFLPYGRRRVQSVLLFILEMFGKKTVKYHIKEDTM